MGNMLSTRKLWIAAVAVSLVALAAVALVGDKAAADGDVTIRIEVNERCDPVFRIDGLAWPEGAEEVNLILRWDQDWVRDEGAGILPTLFGESHLDLADGYIMGGSDMATLAWASEYGGIEIRMAALKNDGSEFLTPWMSVPDHDSLSDGGDAAITKCWAVAGVTPTPVPGYIDVSIDGECGLTLETARSNWPDNVDSIYLYASRDWHMSRGPHAREIEGGYPGMRRFELHSSRFLDRPSAGDDVYFHFGYTFDETRSSHSGIQTTIAWPQCDYVDFRNLKATIETDENTCEQQLVLGNGRALPSSHDARAIWFKWDRSNWSKAFEIPKGSFARKAIDDEFRAYLSDMADKEAWELAYANVEHTRIGANSIPKTLVNVPQLVADGNAARNACQSVSSATPVPTPTTTPVPGTTPAPVVTPVSGDLPPATTPQQRFYFTFITGLRALLDQLEAIYTEMAGGGSSGD